MKPNYKNIHYFLIPYAIFVFGILALVLTIPKAELHLMMTEHRSVAADYFFMGWTELGGTLPYFLIAGILFYRYSAGVFLSLSQILGGIISLAVKNSFGAPRPKLYFEKFYPELVLPVIPGFKLMTYNSFPSGHSITAFALFFGIALITKNKWLKLACFFAAALVAYSRVYLSQHFAVDVMAGSLIGVISTWVLYPFYLKLDTKWRENSLTDLSRKKKNDEFASNSK